MTIEVDDTQREFIEASLFLSRRRRRGNILSLCFSGFAFSWFGWLGYSNQNIKMATFGGAGIYMLLQAVLIPSKTRQGLKKLWKNHPVYNAPQRYTLDETGFSSENYNGHSTMRWHAFSHWAETPRLFLIYFGPVVSYYIPKRCVGDQKRIDALREFLQAAIGRTKYAPPVRAFPIESSAAVIAAEETQTTPPQ